MRNEGDRQAARHLAGQVREVGHASGPEHWREALRRVIGGRLGRRVGRAVIPEPGTPWQDTISAERIGWRRRAASLDAEFVFAVDYRICRRCRLGWVEQPHTLPRYQRCGLASAALAALLWENRGLAWHTLGDHFAESRAFWAAVGADVPGGYEQRRLCRHADPRG
ncbi:hypothetical protein [Streptomyces sp. NPDC002889]|uniref:hypothetical protein n=1 Tax=Streptomyces sp. NPDC002889 TaxID=3364669 RepID=UPI0036881079